MSKLKKNRWLVGVGAAALSAMLMFTVCGGDDNPAKTKDKYAVTVNGGTGNGDFEAGATVNISATVPANHTFTGWTSSPTVTFANASAVSTSFTMPASAVTVTANFTPTGGGGNPWDGMSCNWTLTVPPGDGCWPINNATEWADCPANARVPNAQCGPCTPASHNAQYTTWVQGMGCTWDGTGGTGQCTNIDSQTAFADCRCFGTIMPSGCPDVNLGFTPIVVANADPNAPGDLCHHPQRGQLSCQWGTGCFTINNAYDNFGKPCTVLVQECYRGGVLFTGAVQSAPGWGAGDQCTAIGGTQVVVP